MLVVTFDKRLKSGLYSLAYYLLDHVMGGRERFRTLSVLGSTAFGRFNLHIKQLSRRSL